jgi:hypothetical protein
MFRQNGEKKFIIIILQTYVDVFTANNRMGVARNAPNAVTPMADFVTSCGGCRGRPACLPFRNDVRAIRATMPAHSETTNENITAKHPPPRRKKGGRKGRPYNRAAAPQWRGRNIM